MKFSCFPILSVLIGSAAIASAAVVSGVVVNNKTRQPVVGAEVRLVPKSPQGVTLGALSGRGGRFTFRDVAEGEYILDAKSRAFYGSRVRPARRIAFRAGDSLPELLIELGPTALIAGRVTYEDGAPAAGITVSAIEYGEDESTNTWEAVTDSRGEYRMSEIVPGEFYLVARPLLAFQDSGPLRRQPELGADGKPLPLMDFSPVWNGNTPYRSQAAAIRITEGDEWAPVDLVLRRVPLVTVRGRLLSGVSGRPVNAERLDFVPEGEAGFLGGHGASLAIMKLENGVFEVPEVIAGSYRLTARALEDGEQISVEEIVEVGSEERNINVVLKPPGEIKGVLRVEGNSQLPKEARLRLASAAAEIASDGSFSFRRDPANNLALWLQSPGLYLKAATLNGQRIAPVRVNYPVDCPCTLELVAGTDGRTVKVRIEVPKIAPAGPIQVADFYLDDQTPWPARMFETDEEEIVLQDLPPGRHRLVGWSGVAPCNPREPMSCSSFGLVIDTSTSGSYAVTLPLLVEGNR